jgi:hypothetical protein
MRYCRRKKMQATDAANLVALALVNILEQRPEGRKRIKKDGDKSRMFCRDRIPPAKLLRRRTRSSMEQHCGNEYG